MDLTSNLVGYVQCAVDSSSIEVSDVNMAVLKGDDIMRWANFDLLYKQIYCMN